MDRNLLLHFLMILVVVSAGCNTFYSQGPTDRNPNEKTEDTGKYFPPGVSQSGIQNLEKLVSAHRDIITDKSYTYTQIRESTDGQDIVTEKLNVTVEDSDGFLHKFNRSVRLGGKVRVSGVQRWSQGDKVLIRYTNKNRTEYLKRVSVEDEGKGFSYHTSSLIERFLTEDGSTVSRSVERSGKEMTWVTSTEPPNILETRASNVENYEAVALIDSSGLVHRLYVEYDTREGNNKIHHSFTFNYSAIGSSTVEKPGWYHKAVELKLNPIKEMEIIHDIYESRVTNISSSPPPGFSSTDLENDNELRVAHYNALRNNSYTYIEKYVETTNGRSRSISNYRLYVGEGSFASEQVFMRFQNGTRNRVVEREVWSNSTVQYITEREDNSTTYTKNILSDNISVFTDQFLADSSRDIDLSLSGLGSVVFGPVRYKGKKMIWVVSSTTPSRRYRGVRNYTAAALIDMSGIVHKLHIEYDIPIRYSDRKDSSVKHVVQTVEFTDIGNTTVDKPNWLKRAIANTTKTDD